MIKNCNITKFALDFSTAKRYRLKSANLDYRILIDTYLADINCGIDDCVKNRLVSPCNSVTEFICHLVITSIRIDNISLTDIKLSVTSILNGTAPYSYTWVFDHYLFDAVFYGSDYLILRRRHKKSFQTSFSVEVSDSNKCISSTSTLYTYTKPFVTLSIICKNLYIDSNFLQGVASNGVLHVPISVQGAGFVRVYVTSTGITGTLLNYPVNASTTMLNVPIRYDGIGPSGIQDLTVTILDDNDFGDSSDGQTTVCHAAVEVVANCNIVMGANGQSVTLRSVSISRDPSIHTLIYVDIDMRVPFATPINNLLIATVGPSCRPFCDLLDSDHRPNVTITFNSNGTLVMNGQFNIGAPPFLDQVFRFTFDEGACF